MLRGIARQPYLRDDGSVMRRARYDAHSGMFGAFAAGELSIPDNPTRQQADAALAELEEVLVEFSFAAPHDRAAALGAMLTASIRAAPPAAPKFHVRAPQIASGKSYLCSLIAAFAGPATPSAYAFPTIEEEVAKLMLAALLEAPAVLMFDNLTTDLTPFKSLCSALTEAYRQALRAAKQELLLLLAPVGDSSRLEEFEERAAIMEFDARMSRAEAETAARELIRHLLQLDGIDPPNPQNP